LYDSRLNKRGDFYPPNVAQRSGISAESSEGENLLSLGSLFAVIQNRLLLILVVATVCVGAAVGFSLAQPPTYEASIKLLVGQERGTTDTPREDVLNLQRLSKTMAEGVNSRPVAETVIRQLGLQMDSKEFLKEHLSVQQIPETQFIQVNYEDSSPERAQQGADIIGDVFSKQISEVSPSASAITATVWEPAETPDAPASPHPGRNALLALVLGLMLGTGLAVLLEYLDDSWRSPEEAEQVSGVPTFGVIPNFEASIARKKGGY